MVKQKSSSEPKMKMSRDPMRIENDSMRIENDPVRVAHSTTNTNGVEQKLKYFMENKNFQKSSESKAKIKKEHHAEEPLKMIDGEIIYNPITVEDNELTTSYTYLNRKGKLSPRWNQKENLLFYKTLECCGTEFSVMESIFPNRSRVNLKHKYNRECKVNEKKIQEALKKFKYFDPKRLEELRRSGSD